jgi:hypothetical protein
VLLDDLGDVVALQRTDIFLNGPLTVLQFDHDCWSR